MELFEGFHPEWEKCTWKEAGDTCEKPGNYYCKNKFNSMANITFNLDFRIRFICNRV